MLVGTRDSLTGRAVPADGVRSARDQFHLHTLVTIVQNVTVSADA